VRAITASERPVIFMYRSVSWSTGNSVPVAPNSGDMLAIVARSASDSDDKPAP